MKKYLLSERQLMTLLKAYHKLSILEIDGVDNWSGYMISYDDYVTNVLKANGEEVTGHVDIEDLVESDLKQYPSYN